MGSLGRPTSYLIELYTLYYDINSYWILASYIIHACSMNCLKNVFCLFNGFQKMHAQNNVMAIVFNILLIYEDTIYHSVKCIIYCHFETSLPIQSCKLFWSKRFWFYVITYSSLITCLDGWLRYTHTCCFMIIIVVIYHR